MQFERVGRVPMRGVLFQVRGQIDNVAGFKRTFLDADTAANAQFFRNKGNLGCWIDFYTQLAYCNQSQLDRQPQKQTRDQQDHKVEL